MMLIRSLCVLSITTALLSGPSPAASIALPEATPVEASGDLAPYLGTWQREVKDSTGQTKLTLQLRPDGTYTKVLDAFLRGKNFHGTEDGVWSANGPLVMLSGNREFPASRHDLRSYQKIG